MPLATFSAILDHAIRSERAVLDGLGPSLSSGGSGWGQSEAASRVRAECERCKKQLEAILRENVTELVMEPCQPLEPPGLEPLAAVQLEGLLARVRAQRDFLRDAARSIRLREVQRALEKLAARKDQLLSELIG